jgi:hypothetical protein
VPEGASEDAIGTIVIASDRVVEEGTASVEVATGAISVVCPPSVGSTVSDSEIVGCAASVWETKLDGVTLPWLFSALLTVVVAVKPSSCHQLPI